MDNELSRVVDTLPGLVWTAHLDGRIDFVNQRWLSYTGLSRREVDGPGWQAMIHPEDLAGTVEHWRATVASGEGGEVEARMRRFDGEFRWFSLRSAPLTDESGNVIRWCGINTDIEDRKRAEHALRASEAHFRAIADSIPALIGLMTPAGDLENVNGPVLEYFGVGLEELKGWKSTDTIHPDDLPTVIAAWAYAVTHAVPYEIEHRMRRFDGIYRWFHVRALPLRGADGHIIRWYLLQTDIDDRKRAEVLLASEKESLGKVRAELAYVARVMSLGVLTASIAHEVNQPLSGIITNAGTCLRMLASDPPNIDGARETARRTIRDGHRAADVIARLRALFSKSGPPTETVDLNEATREVVALSSNELQRGGVVLRVELATGLPQVTGDRVQLQQVVLNLLLNAAAAMIGVEDRPRHLLIETARDEEGRVRLTVRDAGVGFELQSLDRLFDAFYTTKSGGMGIGLAVSRSIIESHRGRLWAAPNDGPGATFAFSLPGHRSPETDTKV